MTKFKNNKTNSVVVVDNFQAAGMGSRVIGTTFVLYRYENDDLGYPFVMEDLEFFKTHSEIE